MMTGDQGYGEPNSLLWHKNWIYSCASTKDLEKYTNDRLGTNLKIPARISLDKAQMAVWRLFQRKLK